MILSPRLPLMILATAIWLAACSSSPDTEVEELPSEPIATDEESWTDDLVVSPDWLEARLGADDLAIIHIGDPDGEAYDLWKEQRIPGQTYLPFGDVADGSPEEGFSLPDLDDLQQSFQEAGADDDRQIILTGELDGLMATRAFLSLEAMGRTDGVALLDGGYFEWLRHDRPTTDARDGAPSEGQLTMRDNTDIIVDASFVHDRLEDSAYQLVDFRPAEEFNAQQPGTSVDDDRAGHIPGALNFFWKQALTEGLLTDDNPYKALYDPQHVFFLPLTDITAALTDIGVHDDRTFIAYCRTGAQGSFGYFLARLLDHEPLLYDGSYLDWSSHEDLPIQRP